MAVCQFTLAQKWARAQQAEQKRLQNLLDALPFGALMTTSQGGIYIENKAADDLLTPFGRGDTVPLGMSCGRR